MVLKGFLHFTNSKGWWLLINLHRVAIIQISGSAAEAVSFSSGFSSHQWTWKTLIWRLCCFHQLHITTYHWGCSSILSSIWRHFILVGIKDDPGVQIIWSNSRCRLHTSAALQLKLFVSDLPLNQSEYTADTLSSNQNRVDHRKWNFNVIFTLARL